MVEASGIATDLTIADPVEISAEFVAKHDGTAYTLLLTENLQAQSWALTDNASFTRVQHSSGGTARPRTRKIFKSIRVKPLAGRAEDCLLSPFE